MPHPATAVAPDGAGTSDQAALHAARRLTFGPTPDLVADLLERGVATWLEEQLDPASIPDPDADRRLWALTGLGIDLGRILPGDGAAAPVVLTDPLVPAMAGLTTPIVDSIEMVLPDARARALAELRLAVVVRATYSRRQLLEVMVDHWWNHFNVWPGKDALVASYVVGADRDVIRPHALGRFQDLLRGAAASPAMLAYLDSWQNRAEAPNENFARELLELHTVGVEGGFHERDVADAARAFTGWTIDLDRGRFRFEPAWHDVGAKQVMGWSTAGRRGAAGVEEGWSLLDHLAHHPATARRVATGLVRRLVADDPPPALVASAAAVYLEHGTAIAPIMRHIVASDAFAASRGVKARRPLDLLVAALRATGADIGDPIGPSTDAGRAIDGALASLGHRPFDAPAPDGYPDRAAPWLGAGLLGRWSLVHELARGELQGVRIDHTELAGGAATAGAMVDRLLLRLHGEVRAERRQTLLGVLGGDPSLRVDVRVVPELVGLALSAAELQWR